MKRWIIGLLALAAGIASATTSWQASTNGGDFAYFDDAINWSGGVPGVAPADEKAAFNTSQYYAEAVVTNTQSGFQVVQGDNGTFDVVTRLRIANGGSITTKAGQWSAIGYNRQAHCIVEAGGVYNFGGHCWLGHTDTSLDNSEWSLLDIYGTVSVAQMFGMGFSGGDGGITTIYDGGLLELAEFNNDLTISGQSLLNIYGSGTLKLSGNRTNDMLNQISLGKILGNRHTNSFNVELDIVGTDTNTVITVEDSIPSTIGLEPAEAEDFLALFDYTVGTITTDYVFGALSGHIIDQDPAVGSAPMPAGTPINLVIQESSIPDLVGMDFDVATNAIAGLGLVLGSVSNVYQLDVHNIVIAQDPAAGGLASPGEEIDLVRTEPIYTPQTNVYVIASGDWMNPYTWNPTNIPVRETQGFQVINNSGSEVDLTNEVRCARLMWGANGGGATLNVKSGGHLMTGWTQWTAVGYDGTAVLNVYTNGVFESIREMLFAWNEAGPQNSVINIDGGTVIVDGWIALGRVPNFGTINVKNGGVLDVERFHGSATNGVVNMEEGTMMFHGGSDRATELQNAVDAGWIVIAPGYSYSIDYADDVATLKSFLPGYGAWADSYLPTVLGPETDDYDSDGADNFYEYVMNGDPTNAAVQGVDPVFVDVGGASFQYTHVIRNDDPNLVYSVKTTTDMMTPWGDSGSFIMGTNVTGGAYDEVINSVPVVDDTTFVKLEVVNTNAP